MAWSANEPSQFPRDPRRPPPPGPPPIPPVPLRPLPPPEYESRGLLWSSVPLLTFGLGTPLSFAYAASKRRSAALALSAGGYTAGALLVITAMAVGGPVGALGGILLLFLWIAGTAHSLAVRPSVFPRSTPRDRANQHAIQVARYRRHLRQEARELAASDPALAHELCIGRPDLPRAYDDGGLIDVNHSPKPVLVMLPGMTPELVERILEVRDRQGGFVSVEELAVDADLPADLIPRMKEYAVFLP